jgi:hypothetical protein
MGCGVGAVMAVTSKVASLKLATLIVIAAPLVLGSCGRLQSSQAAISPSVAPAVQSQQATCPITRPPQPQFIPPAAYPTTAPSAEFWYGTPLLWTAIPTSGTWSDLPYESGSYIQKVFWWRDASDWRSESGILQLNVKGVRTDGRAKPLIASTATNAFAADIGSSMLVLVQIPAQGCWKITGQYKDASLSFVIWVPA